MKKIIKSLSAIILSVVTLTAVLTVNAESGQGISLSAENSDNYISVKISTETYITGINGKLLYDTSVLSYENAVFGSGISPNTEQDSVLPASGGINLAVLGNVSGGTKGDFITLNFKIISKESFDANFVLSDASAAGINAEHISVGTLSTACRIDIKYGDVNFDGKVDILDLVRFKKVLAGINNIFSILNSDCDKNSQINTLDMTLLRKFLLGTYTL